MQIPKLLLFIILVVVVCCLLYWSPIVLCGTSCVFNLEPIKGIKKIFVTGGNSMQYLEAILYNVFGNPDDITCPMLHVFDGENLYKAFLKETMMVSNKCGCKLCLNINNEYITKEDAVKKLTNSSQLNRELNRISEDKKTYTYNVITFNNETNLCNTFAHKYSSPDINDKDSFIFIQKENCKAIANAPQSSILKYVEIPLISKAEWLTHHTLLRDPSLNSQIIKNLISTLAFDEYKFNNKSLFNNFYDLIKTVVSTINETNVHKFIDNKEESKFIDKEYLSKIHIRVGVDIYYLLNNVTEVLFTMYEDIKSYDKYYKVVKSKVKTDDVEVENSTEIIKRMNNKINATNIMDEMVNVNFGTSFTHVSLQSAFMYIELLNIYLNNQVVSTIYSEYTSYITNLYLYIDTLNKNKDINYISDKINGNIIYIDKRSNLTEEEKKFIKYVNKKHYFAVDNKEVSYDYKNSNPIDNYNIISGTTITELGNKIIKDINNINTCFITLIEAGAAAIGLGYSDGYITKKSQTEPERFKYHTIINKNYLNPFCGEKNKVLYDITHILAGYDDFFLIYLKSLYGNKCNMYTADAYKDFLSYTLLNRELIKKTENHVLWYDFRDEIKRVSFNNINDILYDYDTYNHDYYYNYHDYDYNYHDYDYSNKILSYSDSKEPDPKKLSLYYNIPEYYNISGYYDIREYNDNINLVYSFMIKNCLPSYLYIPHSVNFIEINDNFRVIYKTTNIQQNVNKKAIPFRSYNYIDNDYKQYKNNGIVEALKNNKEKSNYLLKPDVINDGSSSILNIADMSDPYEFIGFPDLIYNIHNKVLCNNPKKIVIYKSLYNDIRDNIYSHITSGNDWNIYKDKYPQLSKHGKDMATSFVKPNYGINR